MPRPAAGAPLPWAIVRDAPPRTGRTATNQAAIWWPDGGAIVASIRTGRLTVEPSDGVGAPTVGAGWPPATGVQVTVAALDVASTALAITLSVPGWAPW